MTELERTAFVLALLRGHETMAALCARHGVRREVARRWREAFLAGGRRALAADRSMGPEERRLERLACYVAGPT